MNSAKTLELAVKKHQAGNLREAEQLYRQVLQAEPRHADALHLLGVVALQVGRHDLAVEHIRAALRIRPNFAEADCNLGISLQALGQLDEAVTCFRRALSLKWNYAEAHTNLGVALQEQGKLAEAAACYEQSLRLRPNFAEAFNNLGYVLRVQGKLAEAADNCGRALALKPDFAEAHNNLGTALFGQGKLAEATASYERALRLKPNFAEAHSNLGNAFKTQGLLPEALASYERALLVQPNFGDARFNRSLVWLLQGDFKRGWPEYEWRFSGPGSPPRRSFPQPPWQGEPLAGRTILLHAEQGFGDTLHFVRYASLVKRAGAGTVVLECQAPLVRLLRAGCPGVDRVHAAGEPLSAFDVHAPMLSLPRLLGTTSVERIPAGVPYLKSDPILETQWRARLEERMGAGEKGRMGETNSPSPPLPFSPSPLLPVSLSGFRIGIAWQGSPDHKSDHRRSVPLERFAPISRVPGVRLISLQKGPGSEQLAALPGLMDLGRELSDFADTAAALRSLDLVITVDTALAHLAGALGVAAWVALPLAPDWRWLLEREDSPWYPTMRLFRQKRQEDWSEVFERIAAAVRDSKSH